MPQKLQNKIEKLEEKYRVLADNLLDAIWVLDAKTLRYEYMTSSIERISGYTAEEILGLRIQDRLTPESFAKVLGGCPRTAFCHFERSVAEREIS